LVAAHGKVVRLELIVSTAPVRISLGGGGTDLKSYYSKYGGFLMAGAINKYVYILINERFYDSIRLSYSKTEIVDEVSQIEHNIFRESLKLLGIKKGIEIVSIADVPASCGLGTSSTFTVALLNGLYTFARNYLNLAELAEKACEIEIDILEEPIGKQDQYAASFGGVNAYWFDKSGKVRVRPVNISDENLIYLESNMLLFYMGWERSASEILSEQDSKSKTGDTRTIDSLHKIKEIGLETKKAFEEGKIDLFGDLLHEHWCYKKQLSTKVSDPRIDEAYDIGRKNGALGGKVVGAGGGGFLLLYCPGNKLPLIKAMMRLGLKPMWFRFEFDGARVVFRQQGMQRNGY